MRVLAVVCISTFNFLFSPVMYGAYADCVISSFVSPRRLLLAKHSGRKYFTDNDLVIFLI